MSELLSFWNKTRAVWADTNDAVRRRLRQEKTVFIPGSSKTAPESFRWPWALSGNFSIPLIPLGLSASPLYVFGVPSPPSGERVRVRGPPCAYRAVGAETILPRSGAATTISFRVHARPLTPSLSPDGGEGDEGSDYEGEAVSGPLPGIQPSLQTPLRQMSRPLNSYRTGTARVHPFQTPTASLKSF